MPLSFSSPPVVVGLDIGTTKICALVAGEGEDGVSESSEPLLQILGVGIVPSLGVRRGVVVDVPDTVASIKEAVARAAHMAGVEIEGVAVGVTGDHIVSQNRTGSVTVASRGNQITAFDIDRALSAALLEVGRDREIIHSLPRSFSVDEERGIKKPLGIVGTRLEVESHIVTGQSAILRNTLSCISGAGLRADALILEPLASAEAITTRAERDMGVLVLDIGGGTTDLAAYFEGAVVYSAALPVGGNHVTRDVSIGLSTPFEFAEKLKVGSGAATRDMIPHGEALEVLTAGGASRLRIPRALLGEIIEARMRELFEMALGLAMNGGLQGLVPSGLVLSGGGALLPGSVELAGKIFGCPARLGVPEGLSGWSESVSSPQFSTAVGLCRFALAQKRAARQKASNPIVLPQARRVWGQLAPGVQMARPLGSPLGSAAPAEPSAPVAATPETAPAPVQAREEFPALLRFSPSEEPVSAAPEPTFSPDVLANASATLAPDGTSVAVVAEPEPVSAPFQPPVAPDEPRPRSTEQSEAPPTDSDAPRTVRAPEAAPSPRIEAPVAEDALPTSAPVPPESEAPPESPPDEEDDGDEEDGDGDEDEMAGKPTLWRRFLKLIGFDE